MEHQRYAEHHARGTNLTTAPTGLARLYGCHLVDHPDQPGAGLCARLYTSAHRAGEASRRAGSTLGRASSRGGAKPSHA